MERLGPSASSYRRELVILKARQKHDRIDIVMNSLFHHFCAETLRLCRILWVGARTVTD